MPSLHRFACILSSLTSCLRQYHVVPPWSALIIRYTMWSSTACMQALSYGGFYTSWGPATFTASAQSGFMIAPSPPPAPMPSPPPPRGTPVVPSPSPTSTQAPPGSSAQQPPGVSVRPPPPPLLPGAHAPPFFPPASSGGSAGSASPPPAPSSSGSPPAPVRACRLWCRCQPSLASSCRTRLLYLAYRCPTSARPQLCCTCTICHELHANLWQCSLPALSG